MLKYILLNIKNTLQAQRPWFDPQSLHKKKKKSLVGSACKSSIGEVETGKSRDLLVSQSHLLGKFLVSHRLSKYCLALEDCLSALHMHAYTCTCIPVHTGM